MKVVGKIVKILTQRREDARGGCVFQVVHERRAETREQLEAWLQGQRESGAVKGAMEVAEQLVWTFVEQARLGQMRAEDAVARIDALMEFQAHLAGWCEKKAQ